MAWQICLGHDSYYLALLYDNAAVHQQGANHDWHADDGDNFQGAGEIKQFEKTFLTFLKQELLADEVLACVSAQA